MSLGSKSISLILKIRKTNRPNCRSIDLRCIKLHRTDLNFRRGHDGGLLWPGFGDNIRVLEWALNRSAGSVYKS